MVNLIESMVIGYKAMMRSADISGFTELEEEEERRRRAEKAAKRGQQQESIEQTDIVPNADTEGGERKDSILMGAAMVIGSVLGVLLAVALFMYLPALLFKGIDAITPISLKYYRGIIEGVVKMVIFIGYIALVGFEKDIKRVFMYHGAEHKTIFCYEKGLELNIQNVRAQTRLHPRCGTSFMFLMLAIGILISSVLVVVLPDFITSRNYLWVPIKIMLVPIICGLGYELIKLCGRCDNKVTRIIAAPGLWIQRLTTKEPDDSMIEIAIAAVKEVIPTDGSDEIK